MTGRPPLAQLAAAAATAAAQLSAEECAAALDDAADAIAARVAGKMAGGFLVDPAVWPRLMDGLQGRYAYRVGSVGPCFIKLMIDAYGDRAELWLELDNEIVWRGVLRPAT